MPVAIERLYATDTIKPPNMILSANQSSLCDTVSATAQHASSTNWWMWVAILELVIIVVLLFVRNGNTKFEDKEKLKDKSKGPVDFTNIVNSGFKAQKLYDELKIKCHPDRFPSDPEKNRMANDIFQEISKNKNNLKRLEELKAEATEKLGITF